MADDSSTNRYGALSVLPTLFVESLDEAMAFYRRLGFERAWSYPEDGAPTHVGLCFGEVTLMLYQTEPGERIERQNLYFVVADVDGYHAMLQGELGRSLPPVEDEDYQMRDFSINDPWGHWLTFGQES